MSFDYHIFNSLLSSTECDEIIGSVGDDDYKISPVHNKHTGLYNIILDIRSSKVAHISIKIAKNVIKRLANITPLVYRSTMSYGKPRIIKYDNDELFQCHRDSIFTRVINGKLHTGKYNVIVYLNDDYKNGTTTFYDVKNGLYKSIKGKKGDVMIFDPNILHSGDKTEGIKYIMLFQLVYPN